MPTLPRTPSGPAGVRGSVGMVDAGAPPAPVPAGAVDGASRALPSAAAALPPAAAAAACGPEVNLLGVPVTGVAVVVDVTGEGLLTGTGVPVTVVPADGGGGVRVTDVTTCVTVDTTGATVPVTGASV
jgi:hypothetical protein